MSVTKIYLITIVMIRLFEEPLRQQGRGTRRNPINYFDFQRRRLVTKYARRPH